MWDSAKWLSFFVRPSNDPTPIYLFKIFCSYFFSLLYSINLIKKPFVPSYYLDKHLTKKKTVSLQTVDKSLLPGRVGHFSVGDRTYFFNTYRERRRRRRNAWAAWFVGWWLRELVVIHFKGTLFFFLITVQNFGFSLWRLKVNLVTGIGPSLDWCQCPAYVTIFFK